jgi:hypothetical protein
VREGREEGECCGGGEEVECGVVDEFGGVGVAVVIGGVIGVLGGSQFGGRD